MRRVCFAEADVRDELNAKDRLEFSFAQRSAVADGDVGTHSFFDGSMQFTGTQSTSAFIDRILIVFVSTTALDLVPALNFYNRTARAWQSTELQMPVDFTLASRIGDPLHYLEHFGHRRCCGGCAVWQSCNATQLALREPSLGSRG
eukprot:TRINITY_DN12266_c0_g2_i10.p3 TRINITY_DN12266_c0_g2~~TRINITY_DN12266_c0_g2_i10.p3  ORF type:complete len:146 (+),score=3.84 TRINITY_DN12266_c0_g2_i10:2550-2987(+)